MYIYGHSEASRRLPEPVRNCRSGDRRWWEDRRLGRKFELYVYIYKLDTPPERLSRGPLELMGPNTKMSNYANTDKPMCL